MNFSCDSFNIVDVLNLVFFEDFYSDPFIRQFMHTELDFAEGSLSNSFI